MRPVHLMSPLSRWLRKKFIRPCPAFVLPLWLMKPISGGPQTFDMTFPKVSVRQSKLFLAVLKGNPGFYSSLMLLIMHAEGFHCPSCPTNRARESVIGCLVLAKKKDPIFIFIHGRVSTQMTLLAAELPCMTRPVLLPELYVETVV